MERSAFEVRRFDTPQGPVTQATVRIDVRGDEAAADRVWNDAVAGVEQHFNGPGHRLPSGDVLKVEIVRVGPGESAHHTVTVTSEGDTDQNTWRGGQPSVTYAHEVGHMLGLPDEYGRGLDIDGSLMGNNTTIGPDGTVSPTPDVRMPQRYLDVLGQHIGDVPVHGRGTGPVDTTVTPQLPSDTRVPAAPKPNPIAGDQGSSTGQDPSVNQGSTTGQDPSTSQGSTTGQGPSTNQGSSSNIDVEVEPDSDVEPDPTTRELIDRAPASLGKLGQRAYSAVMAQANDIAGGVVPPGMRMPAGFEQAIAVEIRRNGEQAGRDFAQRAVTEIPPTPIPPQGTNHAPSLDTILETDAPVGLTPQPTTTTDQQNPAGVTHTPGDLNQDSNGDTKVSGDTSQDSVGGAKVPGDTNTGDTNTGDTNTGDTNTGDTNTGDTNTGDTNTDDDSTPDPNQNSTTTATPAPTPAAIRDNLPAYARGNRTLGVATQRTNVRPLGTNPAPSVEAALRQMAPGVRQWTGVTRVQRQVDNNTGPMVGAGKRFIVHGDGRPYEFRVQANMDWDNVTQGESTDDKLSASGKEKRTGSTTHTDTREQSISPTFGFSGLPPLIISLNPTLPTGPTDTHTTELKGEYGNSTKVEVGSARDVDVPVSLRFSIEGLPAVTQQGQVGLRVPLDLSTDNNTRPEQAVTQDPPTRFAVEAVTVDHGTNPDYFDQVVTRIGDRFAHTTAVGADGRTVLRDFVSEDTIKSKLPTMATRFNPGPNEGWVRSEPLFKGGFELSPKSTQVEMRAVPRRVRVENDVRTGVKTTDTDRTHIQSSDQGGVVRKGGLAAFVGVGADFQGKGTFAVGPNLGYSADRDSTQKHESSTAVKDKVETTGDVVRYEMVYDIQVRTMGRPPITLAGNATAHQWTTAPRAREAGLLPAPTPATTGSTTTSTDSTITPAPITTNGDSTTTSTDSTVTPAPITTNGDSNTTSTDSTVTPAPITTSTDSDVTPAPNPNTTDKNTTPGDTTQDQSTQDQSTTDPTVFRSGAARTHYGPAELENGQIVPGQFEQFSSNDWFYNTIAPMLRDIPMRKNWGLNTREFVRQFDDQSFTSGLSGKVREILDRDKDLHNNLSDQEIQHLVDRLLGPGLHIPLRRQGWGHDYETTITLTGTLGNVRDGNPLDGDTSTGQRVKDTQTTESGNTKGSTVSGGVQGRVLGDIGTPGTLVLGVRGSRSWSDGNKINHTGQTNYDRKQGDTLKEDGSLGDRKLRQFRADLTVDTDVGATRRLAKQWRKLSFGSRGKHVPDNQQVGTPQRTTVDVRFLLPESTVSRQDPRLTPVTPIAAPTPITNPPAPDNLTGGSRDLDGAQLIGFTRTGEIQDAARRVLTQASGGDPIFAFTKGKSNDIIGNRFSPEAYRSDPRAFSRPVVADGIGHPRRRADVTGAVGVSLTPTLSARQVTASEYEQVTKELSSKSKVTGTSSTTDSYGGFVTGVAVPGTQNPSTVNGTNIGGMGVIVGNVNVATVTKGSGKSAEFESGETLTITGDPERKYLTRVDITAQVVGKVQYKGNLDFDITSPRPATTVGETLVMPESALVWLTADQITALRTGNPTPAPAPAPRPAPDRTIAAPRSLRQHGSGKPSLGLGGITSTLDLTGALTDLRTDLATHIGQDAADRLLPSSGFDTTHDNHREVTRFLSDVNRASHSLVNGGQITPLRLHDRFSGQTYEFNAKADFDRTPGFKGITHVDKLKFSNSASLTTSGDTTRGFTPTGVTVSGRGVLTLRDVPDPQPAGTPPPRTGHGPANGGLGAGAGVSQNFGDRTTKQTDKNTVAYEQSGETSGPVVRYGGRLTVRLSITRHGQTVASTSVREPVSITKIAEDTLPPPQGTRYGQAGRVRPVDRADRTPGALTAWRGTQANGNPALNLTQGTNFTEHYHGDLDVVRDAAVRALRESGVDVTPAAERAIRAAITPAAIKAGMPAIADGTFRVPLPKGLDRTLELHGRIPRPPRFAGTSGTVTVDGSFKTTDEHKSEVVTTSGPEVTTTIPSGYGGASAPSGADSLSEGRVPFGNVSGNTQRDATVLRPAPDAKHTESSTTQKDKTTGPKSATETKSDEKITRTVLSDFEFRFVARQTSKPWFGSPHTGAVTLPVRDAYTIRIRDDHAQTITGHTLPQSLKDATTDLADKGKAWSTAHKETLGRQAAVDNQPHVPVAGPSNGPPRLTPQETALRDAQAKEARAEQEWWDAYHAHQREVIAEHTANGAPRPTPPPPPPNRTTADGSIELTDQSHRRPPPDNGDSSGGDRRTHDTSGDQTTTRQGDDQGNGQQSNDQSTPKQDQSTTTEHLTTSEQSTTQDRSTTAEQSTTTDERGVRSHDQTTAERSTTAESSTSSEQEQNTTVEHTTSAESDKPRGQTTAEHSTTAESSTAPERSQGRPFEQVASESGTPLGQITTGDSTVAESSTAPERSQGTPFEQVTSESGTPLGQTTTGNSTVAESSTAAESAVVDQATTPESSTSVEQSTDEQSTVTEQSTTAEQSTTVRRDGATVGGDVATVGWHGVATDFDSDDDSDSQSFHSALGDIDVDSDTESDLDSDDDSDAQSFHSAVGNPEVDSGDVDTVTLRDRDGQVIGVGFPRAGEGALVQSAMDTGLPAQQVAPTGGIPVVVHNTENGFEVRRTSDGQVLHLDERGFMQLVLANDLAPNSSLVLLSCGVADRFDGLVQAARDLGYHGDIYGPDGPIDLSGRGTIRPHDGVTFRGSGADPTPRLSPFDPGGGTITLGDNSEDAEGDLGLMVSTNDGEWVGSAFGPPVTPGGPVHDLAGQPTQRTFRVIRDKTSDPVFQTQESGVSIIRGGGDQSGPNTGIRERFRYQVRTHPPAESALRVSGDGTIAIGTGQEPKEFFATRDVVDRANQALAGVRSLIRLEPTSTQVIVGGVALTRVRPVLASGPGTGHDPFVSLLRSTCISVANKIMGSDYEQTSEVFLRAGSAAFTISPRSTADERILDLAHRLTADTGHTAEQTAATVAAKQPGRPDDAPLRYGVALREGTIDSAAELGINEHAWARPGEGYGIFSLSTPDDVDHSTNPPRALDTDNVWGYHFEAVVAESDDANTTITLANYSRLDFDSVLRNELYAELFKQAEQRGGWFSSLPKLTPDDDLSQFNAKFDQVVSRLVTDPEIARVGGLVRQRLRQDFEAHTTRAWFFSAYTHEPGQTYHERQVATGFFANPLTVTVRGSSTMAPTVPTPQLATST